MRRACSRLTIDLLWDRTRSSEASSSVSLNYQKTTVKNNRRTTVEKSSAYDGGTGHRACCLPISSVPDDSRGTGVGERVVFILLDQFRVLRTAYCVLNLKYLRLQFQIVAAV